MSTQNATLVCLTHREWQNLCSNGGLRIDIGRFVDDSDLQEGDDKCHLFALAPDRFGIGESSDLIVAKALPGWQQRLLSSAPFESISLAWLTLDAIAEFFPVQEKDRWVFESDAEKAKVRLGGSRLESLWNLWSQQELLRSRTHNGYRLAAVMGLDLHKLSAPDGCEWRDLAKAIAARDETADGGKSRTLLLLTNKELLFDLCREDVDHGSFLISAPVQWASANLGSNVLESDPQLGAMAQELHQTFSSAKFHACLDDVRVAQFWTQLQGALPSIFDTHLKPLTVASIVRYAHSIRQGKPTPDEIIAVLEGVRRVDGDSAAATVTFLFGAIMDSNRVQSLIRHMRPDLFAVGLPGEPDI